jgi:hypothetical protein
MRARYRRWTERPSFTRVVSSLLVFIAVATVLAALGLALDSSQIRGFAEWATVASSLVSGAFYIVGAVTLRHSRLKAYLWFDRGLLIDILVTQVFQFAQEQLAGVTGLVVTITLWVVVRSAIRVERERESLELEDSGGPVAQPVS